jgi:hypothetical protein
MDITNIINCMNTNEINELLSRSENNTNLEITNFNEQNAINNNDDYNYNYNNNNNELYNELYNELDIECSSDFSSESNLETFTSNKKTCIDYYEDDEIYDEQVSNDYHQNKDFGNWQYAKIIVSHSYDNLYTDFLWDYLVSQFQANNDDFNNITKVYYKNNLDIGIIYEFEPAVSKYLVENLKIQSFKQKGYIFNTDENLNKWEFKIVVITTKGIYTANRYITENIIGCY